jgi:hypothetical protein
MLRSSKVETPPLSRKEKCDDSWLSSHRFYHLIVSRAISIGCLQNISAGGHRIVCLFSSYFRNLLSDFNSLDAVCEKTCASLTFFEEGQMACCFYWGQGRQAAHAFAVFSGRQSKRRGRTNWPPA